MHNELNYNQEVYRKLIHLSSSSIPFMLWYFGKDIFLPWIICIAIIIPLLDYGRMHNKFLHHIYNKYFSIITRPIEQQILSGASWVIIGSAITIYLFSEDIAIIGLLVLILPIRQLQLLALNMAKHIYFQNH